MIEPANRRAFSSVALDKRGLMGNTGEARSARSQGEAVEEDSEQVFESLKAGATGYLIKHVPPDEILEAIRQVHRGGAPMSSHIARMVVTAFREPLKPETQELKLSVREAEILRLLARGHRSKEIADDLGIAVGTVNTHIRHVYEKLHVRSRAEAVARFVGGR